MKEHEIHLKYMHTVPYNSAHRGKEKQSIWAALKNSRKGKGNIRKSWHILERNWNMNHVIGFGNQSEK